jgi:hypothetical protein
VPDQHDENSLEPRHLAGRRGTAYECRRCGVEIEFLGIVS